MQFNGRDKTIKTYNEVKWSQFHGVGLSVKWRDHKWSRDYSNELDRAIVQGTTIQRRQKYRRERKRQNLYVQTNKKSNNKSCQYNDNQLGEDGSRTNSRNVVYTKYTTESIKCAP
jgi:hypothetical protein